MISNLGRERFTRNSNTKIHKNLFLFFFFWQLLCPRTGSRRARLNAYSCSKSGKLLHSCFWKFFWDFTLDDWKRGSQPHAPSILSCKPSAGRPRTHKGQCSSAAHLFALRESEHTQNNKRSMKSIRPSTNFTLSAQLREKWSKTFNVIAENK